MTDKTDRQVHINIPVLARVEGEGALNLRIRDNQIEELQLQIYEPPRFFEKLLIGHNAQEVIDIVARICGICPVAYQMSAVYAIEDAFGVQVSKTIKDMRRMLMCGEWIESHALHIHLLAAPDFLGFDNVIEMSRHYPDQVRRGLRLQDLGNRLIKLFGGRSVHPVGVCVGGFHHYPARPDYDDMDSRLEAGVQDAIELVRWLAELDLPEDAQEFVSISLQHADEYAMNLGRLHGSDGLDIDVKEFADHFVEQQVQHSTAKHCLYKDKPYLVGPLARLNNNWQQLHQSQKDLMNELGIEFPSNNMFHSILARAIEIYYALEEARNMIQQLTDATETKTATPVASTGIACTEAPRGILWHQYEFDEKGLVARAEIVPPTAQNQARIEQDLRQSLQNIGLSQEDVLLRQHAEQVIRNYDPCISCATHFLTLNTERV